VRAGDQIVSLDGRPARSLDDVADVLALNRPGRRIGIVVRGPEGMRSASVTLGELP
jgi:S1-C subfamily serine protease